MTLPTLAFIVAQNRPSHLMSLSSVPSLEVHIREVAMNDLEFFGVGFD